MSDMYAHTLGTVCLAHTLRTVCLIHNRNCVSAHTIGLTILNFLEAVLEE